MTHEIFDYPYAMTVKHITEGRHDSSGVWIPQTSVPTSITGHISTVSEKEMQFLPEGTQSTGARKLSIDSSITLVADDQISITDMDNNVTLWYVHKQISTSNIMQKVGISRKKYYIVRVS